MTERSQESLFDRLLKSRYPLTRYLGRQQQFLALLSTAPIPSGTTFTEGETNGIRQRKTPYLSSSKVECKSRTKHLSSMTKIPFSPFQLGYDTPNGMINDQSDNIVQSK